MLPVEQTKEGRPWGNCWEACIASILEIPLEQVPDNRYEGTAFPSQDWDGMRKWMLQEHGRLLVWSSEKFSLHALPADPYILSVYTSPEYGSLPHAVVAQGAEIIHNPHPGRSDWGWRGIRGVWGFEFLVPVVSAPPSVTWLTDEDVETIDPTHTPAPAPGNQERSEP